MGLHSMMNQDQYHASQSEKNPRPEPGIGWQGVTKATPLKEFPPEKPNQTEASEVLKQVAANDPGLTTVNLNNVPVKEEVAVDLFAALETNTHLRELALANAMISDTAALRLAAALETNKTLEKLNLESNSISPQTLIKIFEAINVHQSVKDIKASNQQAQFLGNQVEMAITRAIENNKIILKVGLHLQFGDCRNRVAVQLQKNLDRLR